MILLGNEAVAHGARDAGARVVSSYPGTPSTEITETIAALGGLYAEWAANEKVAAEVAMGAAVAGARAMCCMKHVGCLLYTSIAVRGNAGYRSVYVGRARHGSAEVADCRRMRCLGHCGFISGDEQDQGIEF